MKPIDDHKKAVRAGSEATTDVNVGCSRRDLDEWMSRGGRLPAALAAHIGQCSNCAEQVRRINGVHASMTLIRGEAVPRTLLQRSNSRALRMLRRAARATEEAARALRSRPDLSMWQKTQLHAARISMSAAAALLVLVTRAAVDSGFEQTKAAGEALAQNHWDRHIDPNGEWLQRDDWA